MKRGLLGGLVASVLVLSSLTLPLQAVSSEKSELLKSNLSSLSELGSIKTEAPAIAIPSWYKSKTVNYSITSNGTVKGSMSEFATMVNETLNDPRGWSQLDARFVQVPSGGSFTVILAQASLLPSYSSGCSADWSCNVGRNVIINDDRWMGATTAWNNAGGNLRDYRHMVVNHETGHWLGHDHVYCGGNGQMAPVMQQQSMGLQGCKFNPWPTPSELWSTRI